MQINLIEAVGSLAKCAVNSMYHWISKKCMNKHFSEVSFLYNTSDIADNERFMNFFINTSHKTYL